MEWITALKSTLDYIEKHLQDDIRVETLAQRVYLSPYYLQNGFRIMTGYSLGEYIRNRRLYEAALLLINNEGKITDVALQYGYETPESFSKAFSRFHGITPRDVRKNPQIRCFLPLNVHVEITGGDRMNYVVSPVWGFKVIGFERIFSYETCSEEIPAFWDEICERYCTHTIYAGLAPSCPQEQAIMDNCIGEYGVCIDDVGNGKIRYLIAGRYTGGPVPDGMVLYEFPQGEWAKFSSVGPLPKSLQALNTYIFKDWLPGNTEYEMAGNYNIEWYSTDGEKSDDDYKSGIWIPVRRYGDEAQKRWGSTAQYAQSKEKEAARTKSQSDARNEELMELFVAFGELKASDPAEEPVQNMVKKLQDHITKCYYDCSNEMLTMLGEMYVSDERFRRNIDRRGGDGTAVFVAQAIRIYTSNH